MLDHAKQIVSRVLTSRNLDGKSLVVEIASNDGYLLQYYKEAGVQVLGIEPAMNVARVAQEERGVPTLSEFFGGDLARRLANEGQADVIYANNVVAHVGDLDGFVSWMDVLIE